MATADTELTTANGDLIAARNLSGGRKAELVMWTRPDGTVLGGADAPASVEAEVTIDDAQHTAELAALDLIGEKLDDLIDAGGGGTAIESGGHTALTEYGAYTDAQELADVLDLFAADVVSRLEALEA